MPVPQTSSKEINQQLQRLLHRGEFVGKRSVEYRAVEREIQKLIHSDAAEGYASMGALCSLAGDLEGVRDYYKKALLLPHGPAVRANRVLSLINVGLFTEAADDVSFLERPERGQLEAAIKFSVELGRFRRAIQLITKWNELHKEEQRRLEALPKVVEVLNKAKIDDDDAFLPALDVIGKVLRDSRLIVFTEPLVGVVNHEGVEEIVFRMRVTTSPQATVELEMRAVEALFASNVNIYDSVIRFGFLSASELKRQAA